MLAYGTRSRACPSANSSTWPGRQPPDATEERARRPGRSARSSTGAGWPRRARRRRARSRARPWLRTPNASLPSRIAYTSGFTPSGSRTRNSLRARPVEQREREDAVEPGREADALVLVEVGEDLGVAVRVQPVAAGQHARRGARGSCRSRRCRRRPRSRPRWSSVARRPARPGSPAGGCRGRRRRRRRSPSPSGPRWTIVSVIARISSSSPKPHVPAIPHIRPARSDRHREGRSRSSRPSTAVTSIFSSSSRCRAALPSSRGGRREHLLDRGHRHVVLVLGEVPHEPVAPLLVVGVAAAGGRDEHRGHPEHRRLRRHRGRLAHHELGVRDQVVDVLHRARAPRRSREVGR